MIFCAEDLRADDCGGSDARRDLASDFVWTARSLVGAVRFRSGYDCLYGVDDAVLHSDEMC